MPYQLLLSPIKEAKAKTKDPISALSLRQTDRQEESRMSDGGKEAQMPHWASRETMSACVFCCHAFTRYSSLSPSLASCPSIQEEL